MIQDPSPAPAAGWNLELPTWLAASVREWMAPLTSNAWLLALTAVLGALVLAKVVDWVITFGVKAFTRRTATNLDDLLLGCMHAPMIWSVTILGFAVAGRLVIPNPAAAGFVEHLLLTLTALAWILFGFRAGAILVRAGASHPQRFQILKGPAFPLFDNAVKLVVFFLASWLLISIWGLDTTGWLASAGILGIAIGFAAQETLANLFSGVFILADKPYKVGDFIVLDSGERGTVSHIGLRSTRLLTQDDVEITIPNRVMGQAKIINQSGGPHQKVRIGHKVGVVYGSEIAAVRSALLKAAADCPHAEHEPAPVVRFRAFGESSLDFELFIWVRAPQDQVAASDDLLERMYDGLNQAGIGIPFPQRELWIREAPRRSV